MWCQHHERGRAHRANSRHDIRHFRHAAYQYDGGRHGLTEPAARSLARQAVARHWTDITARVLPLILTGHLSRDDL
jgi:hypothetical protein